MKHINSNYSDDKILNLNQINQNKNTNIHLTEKAILGDVNGDTVQKITLSNRQRQMLDAIMKGMQYKEIAHKYDISENTVAFHISKLKERLNCKSSREIISSALILGLISIDQ